MNIKDIAELLVILATAINTIWIAYKSYKELRPGLKQMEASVEKTDAEVESEIVEAAHQNLEGAKISAQMLLDRINELKSELEVERKARKDEVNRLEDLRKKDADYFRRRIKDLERDARDYRNWAANLAKQVVKAGQIPVPFVPSFDESNPSVTAIRTELENPKEEE